MNASDDSLPLADRQQIDRLADQFEQDFKAGHRPRIEEYLGKLPALRAPVLDELLRLEIELLARQPYKADVNR